MYKMTYNDGVNEGQCSRRFQGRIYGELYLSEAAAQHVREERSLVIDEDGSCYSSPIDYRVEKVSLDDFVARPQCIVILCQRCGGKINDDILPFPLLFNLSSLTREWVINPDDFAHDPGCETRLSMAMLSHISFS